MPPCATRKKSSSEWSVQKNRRRSDFIDFFFEFYFYDLRYRSMRDRYFEMHRYDATKKYIYKHFGLLIVIRVRRRRVNDVYGF